MAANSSTHNLARYCRHEKIEFSRSRANRKNDNCFTEQKNNAVVREHVGYLRLETEQGVDLLNRSTIDCACW